MVMGDFPLAPTVCRTSGVGSRYSKLKNPFSCSGSRSRKLQLKVKKLKEYLSHVYEKRRQHTRNQVGDLKPISHPHVGQLDFRLFLQHQIQQLPQNNLQQNNVQTLQRDNMPRGKDSKPRGRMTAYAFFVQTCRQEHKKKHPEEKIVFREFSKKCALRWKTMSDVEKKRFHEMAEKDKKRYDAEMQNYTPPKGENKGRGKKRKHIKDQNAPKRSLSAFFWFCNDERGKVKMLNPEYGVGDIAKELGKKWSDADPETKSKYEAMAEKDKARYEREMTAYKKKIQNDGAPMVGQAPANQNVKSDSEEDEWKEDDE